MQKTVTSAEMKEIEHWANANHLSYTQMMYNAGTKATEYILQNTKQPAGKVALILAGKGNNGGDGYVVAKALKKAGLLVFVVMAEGLPETEDAKKYFADCQKANIEILSFSPQKAESLFLGADILIDAVYGTGFHGRFGDAVRAAARLVNSCDAAVYALDLPSGLNADTAEADIDAVHADVTIAFHLLKPAHTDPAAKTLCGKVFCADIGIPYV